MEEPVVSKSAQKNAAKNAKFAAKMKKAQEKTETTPKVSEEEKQAKKELKEAKMKKTMAVDVEEISVPDTPVGEKKIMTEVMMEAYNPGLVEKNWYEWWEAKGYFRPEQSIDGPLEISEKGTFVIAMPPPNVTGSLHLGHALGYAIQDSLIRFNRMKGKTTIYAPGCDHAGIATQVVVEKKIQRERGLSRHDLGRDKFLEEVWKWKNEKGDYIYNQIKKLNVSCDWSRPTFTMEPKMVEATTEAFVRLYESGKIKRANRLVNWCGILNSAISDIEVDHIELDGTTHLPIPGLSNGETVQVGALIHFAYKVDTNSIGNTVDDEIVVATTRLETMFGDTAVAVHPDDTRYTHLHGRYLVHPFSKRRIPIILDSIDVDPSFGTGAVKITPAHDFNDFTMGQRHNLEMVNIMNDDGTLNQEAGEFSGTHRLVCRALLVDRLKELGLYRGITSNPMKVPICSRTKDFVEPLLKAQWWVSTKEMAEKASAAVESGDITLVPANHVKTWHKWMGPELKDWCISRQLWWGHRIPAYWATVNGVKRTEEWIVARNIDDAYAQAMIMHNATDKASIQLYQDEDVLDTWFSAGIFPLGIFGWPKIESNENCDFDKFYPGTLLETGHDILFFWVARMVMMGLELTGKIPFSTVYLHSLVRDAHGRKMSKSLGNVIDPLDVIYGVTLQELLDKMKSGNLDIKEQAKAEASIRIDYPNGIVPCGSDALRFTLLAYTTGGRDINLDVQRIVSVRMFCNKLWNAMRFTVRQLGPHYVPRETQYSVTESREFPVIHQWVLSKLYGMVKAVNDGLNEYQFQAVTIAITNFWQYEFCDIYLEVTKPIFYGTNETEKLLAQEMLYTCLDVGLRLLSPTLPFLSEELYQRIPRRATDSAESIIIAPYPELTDAVSDFISATAEASVAMALDGVKAIRAIRLEYLTATTKPVVHLISKTESCQSELTQLTTLLTFLGNTKELHFALAADHNNTDNSSVITPVGDKYEVHVPLKGLVDPAKEIAKLDKRNVSLSAQINKLTKMTSELSYEHKTSPEIRKLHQDKLDTLQGEIDLLAKAKAMYLTL